MIKIIQMEHIKKIYDSSKINYFGWYPNIDFKEGLKKLYLTEKNRIKDGFKFFFNIHNFYSYLFIFQKI